MLVPSMTGNLKDEVENGVERRSANHHHEARLSAFGRPPHPRIHFTSIYKSVSWSKDVSKYRAQLKLRPADRPGLPAHLRELSVLAGGCYESEEDAGRAADMILHKLGRPTNGLLSKSELADLDATSWTDLIAGFRALDKSSSTGSTFSKGSSAYRGVSWNKENGRWQARIRVAGLGQVHLRCYVSEEDAARAYDSAAQYLHGESARLNFKDELPVALSPDLIAKLKSGCKRVLKVRVKPRAPEGGGGRQSKAKIVHQPKASDISSGTVPPAPGSGSEGEAGSVGAGSSWPAVTHAKREQGSERGRPCRKRAGGGSHLGLDLAPSARGAVGNSCCDGFPRGSGRAPPALGPAGDRYKDSFHWVLDLSPRAHDDSSGSCGAGFNPGLPLTRPLVGAATGGSCGAGFNRGLDLAPLVLGGPAGGSCSAGFNQRLHLGPQALGAAGGSCSDGLYRVLFLAPQEPAAAAGGGCSDGFYRGLETGLPRLGAAAGIGGTAPSYGNSFHRGLDLAQRVSSSAGGSCTDGCHWGLDQALRGFSAVGGSCSGSFNWSQNLGPRVLAAAGGNRSGSFNGGTDLELSGSCRDVFHQGPDLVSRMLGPPGSGGGGPSGREAAIPGTGRGGSGVLDCRGESRRGLWADHLERVVFAPTIYYYTRCDY